MDRRSSPIGQVLALSANSDNWLGLLVLLHSWHQNRTIACSSARGLRYVHLACRVCVLQSMVFRAAHCPTGGAPVNANTIPARKKFDEITKHSPIKNKRFYEIFEEHSGLSISPSDSRHSKVLVATWQRRWSQDCYKKGARNEAQSDSIKYYFTRKLSFFEVFLLDNCLL